MRIYKIFNKDNQKSPNTKNIKLSLFNRHNLIPIMEPLYLGIDNLILITLEVYFLS